eukprot:5519330-Prymnesium_polylepis.1
MSTLRLAGVRRQRVAARAGRQGDQVCQGAVGAAARRLLWQAARRLLRLGAAGHAPGGRRLRLRDRRHLLPGGVHLLAGARR